MPRGDPHASFGIAAKHLFRHLHDARALRKNPIVERFFNDSPTAGFTRDEEHVIMDRIQQLVRQGAEHCLDVESLAGNADRAQRQHAIIIRHEVEQIDLPCVAAELGISLRQCYRERADICHRVARFISEYTDVTLNYLPECDEFQLRIDRIMQIATFGDVSDALRQCDDLVGRTARVEEKIEVLRVGAMICLRAGNLKRAQSLYSTAQTLWSRGPNRGDSVAAGVAEACIDLMGSKLAFRHARTEQALKMAQRGVARLEALQASAPPRVRELYVESLYELGVAFCNVRDLANGYESLVRAEALLCHVRATSTQLRARILTEVWKLRNHLILDARAWYPPWQRLKGLMTAFEQAYSAGYLLEATAALEVLTEYHAFAGNDAEARNAALFAISLAKQASPRLRVQTPIRVAIKLLQTRYFEFARTLLPNAEEWAKCDAYHRDLFNIFYGTHAMLNGAFGDALAYSESAMEHNEYPINALEKQIVAAAARCELGDRRKAQQQVDWLTATSESFGSAATLREVYTLAANLTGDVRFRRKAGEIDRVLTSGRQDSRDSERSVLDVAEEASLPRARKRR